MQPNNLAFIALTNEYCQLLETAYDYSRHDLVERLCKLLPRIYISALDIEMPMFLGDGYIAAALDETDYDRLRELLSQVFAEDDTYLEVFLNDMQYSDTPIAVTISENLADLYQEFYNLIASLEDLPEQQQEELLSLCRDNFDEYWAATLCNVLRALNALRPIGSDE